MSYTRTVAPPNFIEWPTIMNEADRNGFLRERTERGALVRNFAGRTDGLTCEREYKWGITREFEDRPDGKTFESFFKEIRTNDTCGFRRVHGIGYYIMEDGSTESEEERQTRLLLLQDTPPPAFSRFERVLIHEEHHGAIVWSVWDTRTECWLHVVHVESDNSWLTVNESALKSLGSIGSEADHVSVHPEISFDLEVSADNKWMEGTFRLPGEWWQCIIFKKHDDVDDVWRKQCRWLTGTKWGVAVTNGWHFRLPHKIRPDRTCFIEVLQQAFSHGQWTEVRGPDSMILRSGSGIADTEGISGTPFTKMDLRDH